MAEMNTYKILNAGATHEALERILNEHAAQGWYLHSFVMAPSGAYVAAVYRDTELRVVPERDGFKTLEDVRKEQGVPIDYWHLPEKAHKSAPVPAAPAARSAKGKRSL